MILRLTAHRTSTEIAVVHAGPELGEFMGAFPAARWQPTAKAYWLPVEQLDAFGRYARIKGHVLVDDRKEADEAEKFTGPLPECASCGQVAPRRAALTLKFCGACGQEWSPVTPSYRGVDAATPRSACTVCEREQPGAFPFCTACGGRVVRVATGKRPDHVPRPKLTEPKLFGEVAAEVVDQLERDHMQRAAGER